MTITTPQGSTTSQSLELLSQETLFTAKGRKAEKTREALAAKALERFTRAQADRFKQERQWYLNLAFYFGQHYVRFKTDTANKRYDVYTPPAPYWRVRPVINQIRKVARKEMSRLVSQQPNAYVVPSSIEDRDVFAAQAAEQIWGSLWRQYKLNSALRRAVFWQVTCGNGFTKQFWNGNKIDRLNELPGDLEIVPVTPFHVFVPDLKEEELENQPFLYHAQMRDRDWLRNRLGEEVMSSRFQSVDDAMYSAMDINHQEKKNTAIVLECWVKEGVFEELPEGGAFLIVNNQVVAGSDGWPYSHLEYPFSKFDAIPTGKFYSDSIIKDLIPLQRELNRTRGQVIEYKNLMAKPRLLAAEGSVDARKITTEPGQIITYKHGYESPVEMGAKGLPGDVTEELNRIYTDMADLSGQHEVSQGQVPPGVTAAVAISYLQEQDESLIATHYDSLEEAVEKLAKQCLVYVKDFWTEERTVKTTGVDGSFDVKAFKGSDLSGNTDIRVEAGSALPTSRAAKQAFIMDLMKMGFIPPERGLEVMEIGGLNKIYEQIQVDARQAKRENLRMSVVRQEDIDGHIQNWLAAAPPEIQTDEKTGLQRDPPPIIPVNTYDNHALHIEEHNRYRKSQAFETAPSHVKRLFEEHVRMHTEAMMGEAAANVNLPPDMQNPLQPGAQQPPMEGAQQPLPGLENPQLGNEQQQQPQGEMI